MDLFVKVVQRTSIGQASSMTADGSAQVIYKPYQWVEAPGWLARRGYHLCVFNSVVEALQSKSFRFDPINNSAWLVECEGEVALPPFCQLDELGDGHLINSILCWPLGTRMFRRVKLCFRLNTREFLCAT